MYPLRISVNNAEIQALHKTTPLYKDDLITENKVRKNRFLFYTFMTEYTEGKILKKDMSVFKESRMIIRTIEKLLIEKVQRTRDIHLLPLLFEITPKFEENKNRAKLIEFFQSCFPETVQREAFELVEEICDLHNAEKVFITFIAYYASFNTNALLSLIRMVHDNLLIKALQLYPGNAVSEHATLLHLLKEPLLFIWVHTNLKIDINQEDAQGRTAFYTAIEENNEEIIAYCISQKACIYRNENPFYSYCKRDKENFALEILRKNPPYLFEVDRDGNTVLHKLIQERNVGTIFKIKAKEEIIKNLFFIKNKAGKVPLQMALETGYHGIVLYFFPNWFGLLNLLERQRLFEELNKNKDLRMYMEQLSLVLQTLFKFLQNNHLADSNFNHIDVIEQLSQTILQVEHHFIQILDTEFLNRLGRFKKFVHEFDWKEAATVKNDDDKSSDLIRIVRRFNHHVENMLRTLNGVKNEAETSLEDLLIKNKEILFTASLKPTAPNETQSLNTSLKDFSKRNYLQKLQSAKETQNVTNKEKIQTSFTIQEYKEYFLELAVLLQSEKLLNDIFETFSIADSINYIIRLKSKYPDKAAKIDNIYKIFNLRSQI